MELSTMQSLSVKVRMMNSSCYYPQHHGDMERSIAARRRSVGNSRLPSWEIDRYIGYDIYLSIDRSTHQTIYRSIDPSKWVISIRSIKMSNKYKYIYMWMWNWYWLAKQEMRMLFSPIWPKAKASGRRTWVSSTGQGNHGFSTCLLYVSSRTSSRSHPKEQFLGVSPPFWTQRRISERFQVGKKKTLAPCLTWGCLVPGVGAIYGEDSWVWGDSRFFKWDIHHFWNIYSKFPVEDVRNRLVILVCQSWCGRCVMESFAGVLQYRHLTNFNYIFFLMVLYRLF